MLVAVTIGGGIAGVMGMLIGVPIAAALYRMLQEELERERPASQKFRLFRKKASAPTPVENVPVSDEADKNA